MGFSRLAGFFLRTTGISSLLQESWRRDIARTEAALDRRAEKRIERLEQAIEEGRRKARALEGQIDVTERRRQATEVAARELAARLAAAEARIRHAEARLALLGRMAEIDAHQSHLVAAWHGRFRPAEICAHVARAVSSAPVHDTPGGYMVVQDLFPADFYDLLVASLPPVDFFPSRDAIKMNLRPAKFGLVPRLTRLLWEFVDTDVANAIAAAALARLEPFVRARYEALFGAETAATVFSLPHGPSSGRLMLRHPGYRQRPHLDPKRAAITVLLYLARPGDSEELGTALYSMARSFVPMRTNTVYPEDHGVECTLAARVPFRANSALIFVNAGAAHGADIPAEGHPADLRRYAFQFYIGPEIPQLLDLVATLPAPEQQQWLGLAARAEQ